MTTGEFGRITFEFETICSADCELYFMMVRFASRRPTPPWDVFSLVPPPSPVQDVNRKSTTVVESWEGSKGKQLYTHSMSRNASVTYTWAFQRTNHALDVSRFNSWPGLCLGRWRFSWFSRAFADAAAGRRHGEAVLHRREQRRGRGGVGVSRLRSGPPGLAARRLVLRALPRRLLHRQGHQPVPRVPGQHAPGGEAHLRPGRVRGLRPGKRQRRGGEDEKQVE